jgi:hypothetical protein
VSPQNRVWFTLLQLQPAQPMLSTFPVWIGDMIVTITPQDGRRVFSSTACGSRLLQTWLIPC